MKCYQQFTLISICQYRLHAMYIWSKTKKYKRGMALDPLGAHAPPLAYNKQLLKVRFIIIIYTELPLQQPPVPIIRTTIIDVFIRLHKIHLLLHLLTYIH